MAKLSVAPFLPGPTINPAIYGHFAEHLGRCIYEGLWVGPDSPIPNTRGLRNDVLEALRALKVPVLRWPGGCFADEYHWRDGIGPQAQRKRMVNTHWGGVVEDNSFGTHEFLDLCELIGCEPYVNGNVGSGDVREMSEWVEYMTFDGDSPMANLRRAHGRDKAWKVKYFGVGNESWGCGGNMRPEYYADLYRRFQTYVRNYEPNRVYRIACGANVADYRWTEVLMRESARYMDGLSLHHYAFEPDWDHKGPATGFAPESWHRLLAVALRMDELITRHSAIMDQYDPDRRIGLIVDEWGAWHQVEPGTNPGFLYQQNSLRDALVAGVTLNIFHKHAARVHMANLAQMVNVLQSVLLTDGARLVRTPTYHVLRMFQGHQGARLLDVQLEAEPLPGTPTLPRFSATASVDAQGAVRISLCHLDPVSSAELTLVVPEQARGKTLSAEVLTGDAVDAHNTFEAPNVVVPQRFTSWKTVQSDLVLTVPARSVVVLTWS